MRLLTFSGRNAKEILRDPLTAVFGLGFPIVLILLLSALQANIPVSLFELESLTPGMTIFGLSFMTLFSATLIAKDRESTFLQRLYTSPLTAADFIFGYTLPILPIAVAQCLLCYVVALILGLSITVNIVYAVLFILPAALFFIALGLLFGSLLNVKQVGGLCGALLTNLSAWLSGIWFDLELVGGAFKKIAYLLPFVHAVELERAVLSGNMADIFPHLYWVLGYAAAASIAAILVFRARK
ncbi:MAG: ABC transporter permease [Lachnospiraceae bacterium]|nr:ABC transporter permease [Lachnospiraceae bacterium]